MSWDYRVAKRKSKYGDDVYVLHEVSYDDDNNIEDVTYNPIIPVGDDLEDLREQLQWMLKAIEKPILKLPKEISNETVQVSAYRIFSMEGDKEEST